MAPEASVAPAEERPRSIAHLIASNFAGGPEKQILELSVRLREAGWPVAIGSFREGRPSVEILDRARERGLETFVVDTRGPFDPSAVSQVRRQLRARRVEVLLTHGYKSNLVGRWAAAGTPARAIPVVRGFTGEDWKVRIYERLDRWVLRRSGHLIAVSEATAAMLEREGVRSERIEVIHNAVDCERRVEALDLRGEYGLPAEAFVAVAAGRLSPEKAHRFLVEAVAGLDPRVHVLLFGSGREETALRAQIARLGLEDRVVLAGFRKDVVRALAGADLVVNPSLTEGLPNVVLEAMAVGTAVVATDVGGVAELVLPGRTGWLVPAADPVALATAIDEALRDVSLRHALAEGGRDHVRRGFSFEGQARRFRAYVAALASRV